MNGFAFYFFFGMNSSANTIIRMDATFGSRRGAVLQQNPESAHRLKPKGPLSRKAIGVGLVDTIDGVHTVGGMSKKNIFRFFLV